MYTVTSAGPIDVTV